MQPSLVVAALALSAPLSLRPAPSQPVAAVRTAHHSIALQPRESCEFELGSAGELEALLPNDAVVVVRAASVNALLAPLASWSGDPAMDPAAALAEWVGGLDPTARDLFGRLDLDRPAAFALALDAAQSPHFTLALPALDSVGLAQLAGAHVPLFRARASGGYVVLESAEAPAASGRPNAAALALAGRDLGLHVDLARLRTAFGPLIEVALDQAEVQLDAQSGEAPAAALALEQFDDGRRLLASAESFDAYAVLGAENVQLQGRLELRDDTWTRARFGATPRNVLGLARLVDPQAALSWVQTGEQAAHASNGLAALQAVEGGLDARLRPALGILTRALTLLRDHPVDASVFNVALGVDGLQGSLYLSTQDSAALVASLAQVFAGEEWRALGLEFSGPHESTVGGAAWREYSAKFDVERLARQLSPDEAPDAEELAEVQRGLDALLGPRGLSISLANKEGLAIVRVGGGDAHALECIARTERPQQGLPPALADAFADANGACAASIVQFDLGRLLAQAEGFAATLGESLDLPAELRGEGLPITFHAAAAPRSISGGLSIDARQLARFLRALREP
jgi:hypothetical protein